MAKIATQRKLNIPIVAAVVLLCLIVVTVYLANGLYARYSSSGSGNDSARVITFGELTLTETGDFADGEAYIIPGVNLTKKAVVAFEGSESATYVFAEVELQGGWTTTDANNSTFAMKSGDEVLMQWSIASGWEFLDGTTYVYYRELAPNIALDDVDIIKDGEITVSEDISRSELQSLNGVAINLRAFVVQSGGFDSATAAWNSLAAKNGGGE